jgi:hypothetical protein
VLDTSEFITPNSVSGKVGEARHSFACQWCEQGGNLAALQ